MENFLGFSDELQEEEKAIQELVRKWVNHAILPQIADYFEQAIFPKEIMQEIAKLGLLGMTLPEKYGGAAAGYVAYGLACQELERADSGIRSFMSVQSSLCMYPIFQFGTEEQKQKFLPLMAKAELIGCFGLTEPDAGSDPASMRTFAKAVPGGWLLNGSKAWITNAPFADLAVVWAKTTEGIRGFLVEKEFKGFERKEIHKKMALRASATGELVFQDCFIPSENYLPGSEKGLAAALQCLTQARYGIAWGAMGAAEYCFEKALEYSKERKQFGKSISAFQLIQQDFVNMFTEIQKAKQVNLRLGRLKEAGKATFAEVSFAKRNACKEALAICRQARSILGANGISLEYHIIRHMNNLEAVVTYEGTENIHTLILGKLLTGMAAFD